LQWLAVGVLVNATAQLPYTLIQAAHRPDLVGKVVLLELPVFLVVQFLLIKSRGIEGAAMAWSGRLIFETLTFWIIVTWLLPEARTIAIRAMTAVAVVLCLIAMGILLPATLSGQLLFLIAALTFGVFAAWTCLLTKGDKKWLIRRVNAVPSWVGF
jgi:O-antigen/teichoic acid export membrane protein